MKLLGEDEMVQLVEASPVDRSALAERMRPVNQGRPAQWLTEAVDAGHYNVTTVIHQGRKVAVFWWWYSPGNKALVLNWGASLVKDIDTLPLLIRAFTILAKKLGAQEMQTRTRRAGLIKLYREAGWTVEAVSLRKAVC